jgi:hypothetical protein
LAASDRDAAEVFRLDADGTHDISHVWWDGKLVITDRIDVVGVYVLATESGRRAALDRQVAELLDREEQTGFDPVNRDRDFKELGALLSKSE